MRNAFAGLMLTLTLLATDARADPAPPNVVVILADDLGYSDLGCYGGEIRTPNLDGLAAGGLRFTQFTNTARCWPTRAAILTGYYAQQVRRDTVPGVPSGSQGKRPGWARLLPEMLRPAGYRSYHSGKWHIDGMPRAVGFDHSYYVQDLGRYFRPRVLFEDDRRLSPVAPGSGYYSTTAIAEHAIEYLREHARDQRDRPFFLYLAFNAPHFPLQAPPEDIARYRDRYRAGWEAIRAERWRRVRDLGIASGRLSDVEREVGPPYDFPDALKRLGPGEVNRPLPWGELTDEQRAFQATKMAIHAAMVDRMDREIGRVLDQVRAMGAWEDTLIVFLSDNGASAEIMVRDDGHDPSAEPGSAATHLCLGPGWSTVANTPFRRHKTWVHEGGIATPFIVHWPKGIAARGELRHNPGHVIDLAPTILEVAKARRPETWEGRPAPEPPGKSLVVAFGRDGTVPHDDLWWEHEGNRAIRVGNWKLVAARDGPWELFDLSTDRAETRDRARDLPEKVRELERRWQRRHDEFAALARRDAGPARADDPKATPAAIEPARAFFEKQDLFKVGDDPSHGLYHIPGLVVTARGSVLAWCEARKRPAGVSDWDDVRILLRRSTDDGKTWSPPRSIADVPGPKRKNPAALRLKGVDPATVTYHNPVLIADRDGTVHMLFGLEYMRCFYQRSEDDGLTWGAPVEITRTFDDFKKDYAWAVLATGPDHGIQLRTGRLIVPVWLSTGTGGNAHRPSVTATIYSDDRGATWKRGEIAVPCTEDWINPNEAVAVELADGRVMLNVRSESRAHRRLVITSPDGASRWDTPRFDDALLEPICMGGLVRYDGGGKALLLFSNPHNLDRQDGKAEPGKGRDRKNLCVKVSRDEGRTWAVNKTIEPGPSMYSDLAVTKAGTILCFYGRGTRPGFAGDRLTLARFNLEWLFD